MLAITLIHVGVLFAIGNPEPLPIVTSYLGMLLMGGCFISVGLLISSMTKNQIVAGMVTFVVFLMLWVIDWIAIVHGTRPARRFSLPLVHAAPDRLHARRHRHETRRLLRQLHRVRPVPDGALGRHGKVAGLVMQRALNILGWIGTAIVFVAVAVRFLKPEWEPVRRLRRVERPGAGRPLHARTMARDRRLLRETQRPLRRMQASRTPSSSGLLVGSNYLSNRRNKRWELTSNKQYSLSDQSGQAAEGWLAAAGHSSACRQGDRVRSLPDAARGLRIPVGTKKVSVVYVDPDRPSARRQAVRRADLRTIVSSTKGHR
jgi:hypothetical protein